MDPFVVGLATGTILFFTVVIVLRALTIKKQSLRARLIFSAIVLILSGWILVDINRGMFL